MRYILAAPFCAGAVSALFNDASSLYRNENYLAEQVLIALLKMRPSVSQLCSQLIDAFISNHCSVELAGNTIVYAIETAAQRSSTIIWLVRRLYRVIQLGAGVVPFCAYAQETLCIADFEEEWIN